MKHRISACAPSASQQCVKSACQSSFGYSAAKGCRRPQALVQHCDDMAGPAQMPVDGVDRHDLFLVMRQAPGDGLGPTVKAPRATAASPMGSRLVASAHACGRSRRARAVLTSTSTWATWVFAAYAATSAP
jgi:hypothetical protein